jgi:hypothetical protein
MPKKNKYMMATFLIVILALVIFFGSPVWVYMRAVCFGRQAIFTTAKTIVANETEPKVILDKIADWLMEHMTYDTSQIYYYPIPPFLLYRISNPDPAWVMTVKRGGCEEHAILFAEMVRVIGIQSRVVHNPGEDHTWTEVLINGSWIHYDPMLPKEKRFNNPGFYELPRSEGGWGKQLSYVFFIGKDGKKHDITHRYTETGRLIVRVEKDNKPVENARVIIKSRFLMENYPNYKEPLFSVDKYTNKSGLATFDLGANNYTIIAELGVVVVILLIVSLIVFFLTVTVVSLLKKLKTLIKTEESQSQRSI